MLMFPEIYTQRPTRAEVHTSRLAHNFHHVQSLIDKDTAVMAVIKANAYGHGIVQAAQTFLREGASYLGVAYLEEALFLRKNNITAPILVMGAINTEQIDQFILNDIDITTSSLEKSAAISQRAKALQKEAVVHIKVDTGMERIGVHWYNAEKFIRSTFEMENLSVKGIFSHLSKGESDNEYTGTQIERFETVLSMMSQKGLSTKYQHLANSAGVLYNRNTHYSMVRPGLALYGYDPRSSRETELLPAMTLKTKVSYFKVVPGDTGISYNHSYTTGGQTRIVTLPVGYGDGYRRDLSNKGYVAIRGKHYPVTGTVCMDQVMVDISMEGTAYNGDDVILFGKDPLGEISLDDLCERIGTIPYEFLCGISARVPRIYI